MWTKFFDMSSGGTEKTKYSIIYIEFPEEKAKIYFKDKFGVDPDAIICQCCGRNFSVSEIDGEPQVGKYDLAIPYSEINA